MLDIGGMVDDVAVGVAIVAYKERGGEKAADTVLKHTGSRRKCTASTRQKFQEQLSFSFARVFKAAQSIGTALLYNTSATKQVHSL